MVEPAKRPARSDVQGRRIWFVFGWVLWLLVQTFPLHAGNFYPGTMPATVPWPGGVIPYQFTNALTTAQSNTFFNGIREWQLAANVQFVPHTTQSHWVLFTYNTNFIDMASGTTNPQVVTVSSLSRGQVCHEMGHSLGFQHENIRYDRTNYLTVLTNNISPSSNLVFFAIDPTTVTNGAYDFESVMHLGDNFSSIDPSNLYTQLAMPPYFAKFQPRMGNACLSRGDRAAASFLYGPPAVPLSNIVTNTLDYGPGSLRAAMYYASDHPGTPVQFNISTGDPGHSNGVYYIHLTGFLPPLVVDGTVIDGSTQPGFSGKPLIVIDGSQVIPEAYPPGQVTGLLIYAANCQIKNLSLQNFSWNGITLDYPFATNNTISGCWLGPDYTGTNAAPNALQGILIYNGASSNLVGGTTALTRNILSGNIQYGVLIDGTNTTGNKVIGNYIGTDYTGTRMLSNSLGGVFVADGSVGNFIGSTNAGAGNVISGNLGSGILLRGSNVVNETIAGNFIGVDASGTNAMPNSIGGVTIDTGSRSNMVGGRVAGARNVISSNQGNGVLLRGPGVINNTVAGNFIGTDASGTNALPNTVGGVTIDTSSCSNVIGGTVAGARNIISGNQGNGVLLRGIGVTGNTVEGNYIGTDVTGTKSVANTVAGVTIDTGAGSNLIGGTIASAGNVISGNQIGSAFIYGMIINAGSSGNVVAGNYIGLDASGTVAVPNWLGISCFAGASNNIIGGTSAGAGNYISGNGLYGVFLIGPGGNNLVEGNFIGTDHTGKNPVANVYGVEMQGATTGNIIGGTAPGAGNVIAFGSSGGVIAFDPGTTNNAIRGNSIYSNNFSGIALTVNAVGKPAVTNVFGLGFDTVVKGSFSSVPNQTYIIDVYRNLSEIASGTSEGQFYVGSVTVTTSGAGNTTFVLTNTSGNYTGQYFTATATYASGSTSEFSPDFLATNLPAPGALFAGSASYARAGGFSAALNLVTNFSYHIQGTTNLGTNPIPWVNLTNFTATNSLFNFTDPSATNFKVRFYRVISP